jgi:uncharacterized protein (TIGR03084 family)
MQQSEDFLGESQALCQLISPLTDAQLSQPTAFKDWTLNDVVGHLHLWNWAADLSLRDGDEFQRWFAGVQSHVSAGSLRTVEQEWLDGLSGQKLLDAWQSGFVRTAANFATVDPSLRVKWAGPDMSARSSITARLMETWAHGQEIYDCLGVVRENTDRIHNIVILGINTYGWTFKIRQLDAPAPKPFLRLLAPSGELWTFGEANDSSRISGLAEEFCQVVTQVRNIADTDLEVVGESAAQWMATAQCFAGPPEQPPAAGTRHTAGVFE